MTGFEPAYSAFRAKIRSTRAFVFAMSINVLAGCAQSSAKPELAREFDAADASKQFVGQCTEAISYN